MKNIVWLASYPKSGNTWFRALLANYWGQEDAPPADINNLGGTLIASARTHFDEFVGVAASDLTSVEVNRLRPRVYEHLNASTDTPVFVKVHDCYHLNPDGDPLFPAAVTARAIYIVRNPLDVALSWANHNATSIRHSIYELNYPRKFIAARMGGLPGQLPQLLKSWSEHVRSWLDDPEFGAHVIRYEDLHNRPIEVLRDAIAYLGIELDEDRLVRAVEFAAFNRLKRQEEAGGFFEKPRGAKAFFNKGVAGAWQEALTPAQVALMRSQHGPMMERLGYSPHPLESRST